MHFLETLVPNNPPQNRNTAAETSARHACEECVCVVEQLHVFIGRAVKTKLNRIRRSPCADSKAWMVHNYGPGRTMPLETP